MGDSSNLYEAWHRELGHSEYRVRVTMGGLGSDEDAADALLDGMLKTCPELGPVISQDAEADTIAVTVAVNASTDAHAVDLAIVALLQGGTESGLPQPESGGIEVWRIVDKDPATEEREALPA